MTALDTAALRALAESVLPGPWNADVHDNGTARVYFAPDATDDKPAMAHWIPAHGYGAEAEYIAAVNPATVLALLDAAEPIERVQALADEYEAVHADMGVATNPRMRLYKAAYLEVVADLRAALGPQPHRDHADTLDRPTDDTYEEGAREKWLAEQEASGE